MTHYRTIDDLPAYLRELLPEMQDKRTALLCPQCGGGQTRERSLGMYRIWPHIVLKCYRGKCSFSARVPYTEGGPDTETVRQESDLNPYEGELTRPPSGLRRFMLQKYGILGTTLAHFSVRRVPGLQAIYMPVFGPYRTVRGGVVRRFDDWGRKADSFKASHEPWQAWYTLNIINPKATAIVEDQISAMRCWQLGYDAVALLGADITAERAQEIESRRFPQSSVFLALDGDMWAKACSYAKQLSWISKVVMLEDDIKDMTDAAIEERLHG